MTSIDRRTLLKSAAFGAVGTVVIPNAWRTTAAAASGIPTAFEGVLTGLDGLTLVLKVGADVRKIAIDSRATFWRGGDVAFGEYRRGDVVLARTREGGTVDRAWANLGRVRGVIRRPLRGGYEIVMSTPAQHRHLVSALFVDGNTVYQDFRTMAPRPAAVLTEGSGVEAIGLVVDGGILATTLGFATPGSIPAARATRSPVIVERNLAGSVLSCTYQYYGYASWFDCSTGAGRCGTCDANSNAQVAWPAMDPICNCCSSTCCDCSNGCMNQEYASCGNSVTVVDSCNNRARTFSIVSCGPCQRVTGCQACTPLDLCTRTCADCYGRQTAVVDLTKPSFAVWYDPAARGCFSCIVQITLPC